MWLVGFLFAIVGSAGFALAIDRHWRLWFGDRPQPRRERLLLRIAAAAFLAESLILCLRLDPISIAVVFWCVEIMLAAIVVGIGFALKAHRRR